MPELLPIQAILFQNLLRDFQIIAPPRVPVWWMSDVVQPVALVNSQVTLDAVISETAMQFATQGTVISPLIGAILADTGQLPAGTYLFRAIMSFINTSAINGIILEHRDPADAANVWEWEGNTGNNSEGFLPITIEWVETVVLNERIRATNRVAGSGQSRFNVIIWRRLLT